MAVLTANALEETALFIRLKLLEDKHASPPGLSGNVLGICREAAERLKIFPAIHEEFSLHDETHCLRVVQLMGAVAGGVLERLNAIELALLILAAYLHDQGMVVEAAELDAIRLSEAWQIHEQNWSSDHPNYGEALAKLGDPLLVTAERDRTFTVINDLRAGMFTDFIRATHANRGADYVTRHLGADPRLVLHSRSVASLLALLCDSHARPAEAICPANGYQFDELIGTTKVNVALLAYILRMADILDFDRDRTPESLYRAIHFTSPVSLLEWEKHRSVTGWEVGPARVAFAAECDHPAYERAIREFFTWIDDELCAVQSWNRKLPAEFNNQRLELAQKVDTDRVGPRVDPVSRQPAYWYSDLEFALSRDEIVKLLMTNRLYSNKSLFIRELLQNALDALCHRRALYQADGVALPDLHVEFEHSEESGFDVVRCRDNGAGMDKQIIARFLTRVGRSYYRSPEFERERARFREKRCDFDPCARFGIGFMSCFMFGDEIKIHTRRDYGMGRDHGQPLIVEINGLSNIVVIRPGAADQAVGTTVEVLGRRKSFTVDEWSDPVNLLEVLEGYAIAAEFPITGQCHVPAIHGHVSIVPVATALPDPLETIDVGSKHVFAVDLANVDRHLLGEFRVCTLVDASGTPSTANEAASIEPRPQPHPGARPDRVVRLADGTEKEIKHDWILESRQVSCDGILVVGQPGRGKRHVRLGWSSCHGSFGSAAFLIDARGELKPNLTPARTAPETFFDQENTWRRLFDVAGRAYSILLDEIIERCAISGDPGRFWAVSAAYDLDLHHLQLLSVWRHVHVPTASDGGSIEWCAARGLVHPHVSLGADDKAPSILRVDEARILALPGMVTDFQGARGNVTVALFERLIMGMSTITAVSPTTFELTLQEPPANTRLCDLAIKGPREWRWCHRCAGELADAVCVTGDRGFANAEHSVAIQCKALAQKRWEEYSPFERVLSWLTWGNVGDRFDKDVPANSRIARTRKALGLHYRAVDWGSVDPSLAPPYRVFRPGIGIDELTEAHLERWAQTAASSDAD